MRYLNTKNLIAAGVLLACMSSIAWGAIIPDRTRIIMNESDKGEALKLTNQSKIYPIWRKHGKKIRKAINHVTLLSRFPLWYV